MIETIKEAIFYTLLLLALCVLVGILEGKCYY